MVMCGYVSLLSLPMICIHLGTTDVTVRPLQMLSGSTLLLLTTVRLHTEFS